MIDNYAPYILDAAQTRDLDDAMRSWIARDRIDGRHRNRHSRADRRRISRGAGPRRSFPGWPALARSVRRLRPAGMPLATFRGVPIMAADIVDTIKESS